MTRKVEAPTSSKKQLTNTVSTKAKTRNQKRPIDTLFEKYK